MPPARTPPRGRGSVPGYQATAGTRAERAVRDVLPGHPLARHINDFLTGLANANKPHNTIRPWPLSGLPWPHPNFMQSAVRKLFS